MGVVAVTFPSLWIVFHCFSIRVLVTYNVYVHSNIIKANVCMSLCVYVC